MPDLDGNDTQARKMAKQLFSVWQTEQEAERRKFLGGSIPAWVACLLSLGTLIWGASALSGDVSENRRRIEAMESGKIGERLARIEEKLDLLMAERKGE